MKDEKVAKFRRFMHKEASLDGCGVPSANFTTLHSLSISALQLSVWLNAKFAEGAKKW